MDNNKPPKGSGLVLGKFLPPHRGHQYLIDFAQNYVSDVTVLLASLNREPIPGKLRYRWLKEMFPNTRVAHCTDELPQYPHEHENFWNIWLGAVRKYLPTGPDYVFASEDYGKKLAEVLGAEYIPVDHDRELSPVSGEKIRIDPMAHWEFIPAPVRPYFLKKVCLFGPESTGKSRLTADLAARFNTVYVHEYARLMISLNGDTFDESDMTRIARGHLAAEEAMARHANRVLFSDTDLLTTTIWSRLLYGRCEEWIEEEAEKRSYDLYLLLDIDTPWVDDNQRFLSSPEERKTFFDRCEKELKERNRPYTVIKGSWEQRLDDAVAEVEKLLSKKPENPYKALDE